MVSHDVTVSSQCHIMLSLDVTMSYYAVMWCNSVITMSCYVLLSCDASLSQCHIMVSHDVSVITMALCCQLMQVSSQCHIVVSHDASVIIVVVSHDAKSISQEFPCSVVNTASDLEILWLIWHATPEAVILGICYRCPHNNPIFSRKLNINFKERVAEYPNVQILLFGDFSFPNIDWTRARQYRDTNVSR